MSETWRQIPGFEGQYEVSDLGRVRSVDREVKTSNGQVRRYKGMILSPGRQNDFGHVTVMLGRDGGSRCVHELVLLAFVGPAGEGQECRHLDGDGANNKLSNLWWGSKSENGKDTTRLKRRKLTYDQVGDIRKRFAGGETQSEIARAYGVLPGTIGHIVHGRQYVK